MPNLVSFWRRKRKGKKKKTKDFSVSRVHISPPSEKWVQIAYGNFSFVETYFASRSKFKLEQKKCGFPWKCPEPPCLFQGDGTMGCKFFHWRFIGHPLSLLFPFQMTTPLRWRGHLFPRFIIHRWRKSFFPLAHNSVSLSFSHFWMSTSWSEGSHSFLGLHSH